MLITDKFSLCATNSKQHMKGGHILKTVKRVYRKKVHKKEYNADLHALALAMIAIIACVVSLCGASWAWFTANTSTATTQIQSSSYKLLYQVGDDTTATELAEKGTAYTLTANTTVITLSATGTAGATGYCSIKVGSETYYTEQIFENDTFTFTINAAKGTTITLTPKWGSCAVRDASNSITKDGEITATGSQPSSIQTPNSTVTAEPSTEPTTPTTPTAPSNAPTESATTTDAEPTPASEDTTTPANTDKTE